MHATTNTMHYCVLSLFLSLSLDAFQKISQSLTHSLNIYLLKETQKDRERERERQHGRTKLSACVRSNFCIFLKKKSGDEKNTHTHTHIVQTHTSSSLSSSSAHNILPSYCVRVNLSRHRACGAHTHTRIERRGKGRGGLERFAFRLHAQGVADGTGTKDVLRH